MENYFQNRKRPPEHRGPLTFKGGTPIRLLSPAPQAGGSREALFLETVFQGDAAVENQVVRPAVLAVQAEIPQAHELEVGGG